MNLELNCYAGEGIANEERLFGYIDSCSIACGGHFGNHQTMTNTVRLGLQNDLNVGAHPSYPDLENFGRKSIEIDRNVLKRSIKSQIGQLKAIVDNEGGCLHHIKAHGALYNDMAASKDLSEVFLESIEDYKQGLFLFVSYQSEIEKLAIENGFKIKYEAFADRNYNSNLKLVSRQEPNALIEDPNQALEHILMMREEGMVKTIDGDKLPIKADTFCVHGDTASAFKIVSYIRQAIPNQKPKH